MLTVTGLITIPNEPFLKRIPFKNGMYLDFFAVSVHSQNGEMETHRYRCNLYVPEEEIEKWDKRIVPGNTFLVTGGKWSSKEPPPQSSFKTPFPILKLTTREFKKLVAPLWAVEEKEK